MMNTVNWRLWLSVAALIAVISGCSSTPEPDYAELSEIDAQITPRVAWNRNVGAGTDEHFSRLAPVYADGVVFTADRHGGIQALNVENGRPLWTQDVSPGRPFSLFGWWRKGPPARLSGGLILDGDSLYVGSENGELFALDTQSGDIRWRVHVPGEVVSAPAAGEGRVAVQLGNGVVVALDASDGEELWRHEEEVPALSLRGTSSPVIAAGGVMIGTSSGRAAVLILEDGQMAWDERIAAPTGGSDLERMVDIDATPVVRGDTLYMLAYNGELIALELRSGEVIWRRDYAGYRTPQITGNRIFITTTNSHIAALERINGNERWRNNDLYGRSLTEVTVLPDYLVTADRFGVVHWLDRESGQIVGRHTVRKDSIQVAPVQAGDYLIVQTVDGRLIALTH